MNLATVTGLISEFNRKYPRKPTQENQFLTDRIRRALSWIRKCAVSSEEDSPLHFVQLWIALNALYGQRYYEFDHRDRGDIDDFRDFLGILAEIDENQETLRKLMKRIESLGFSLIENPFVWDEYWREQLERYEEYSRKDRKRAIDSIQENQAIEFFCLVFPRLLVLRNQIFHGGSSEHSRKNIGTLSRGLRILEALLTQFIRLMIQNGEKTKKWPKLPYPAIGTPHHPYQKNLFLE